MTQSGLIKIGRVFSLLILVVVTSFRVFSQPEPTYRTFNQVDLAEKKAKPGKAVGSTVCFTFRNDSAGGVTVNSLHVRLNSTVVSIIDSGGFTSVAFDPKKKGKVFDATGRTVTGGDSVKMCFRVTKKDSNTQAVNWYWDVDGAKAGDTRSAIGADPITIIYTNPNGGNVREYLYKHVIQRPAGVVIGLPNPTTGGWIRYKTADRKYFPHTDSSRCFDYIVDGRGFSHPFIGELKNPHVKKHNNHLLGEVHALKLAIIANDSGVTQPDTPAVRLGDIIYNDGSNPSDPCNGLSLRGITKLADSALTYCSNFVASFYTMLDTCVSRVNRAFDGPYVAASFSPFELAGTHAVSEYAFLHLPPSAEPVTIHRPNYSIIDQPEQYTLAQNYPNPFNPTTTINFSLAEPSVVTLKIYNVLGQEVATLFDREGMENGDVSVEFTANDIPSGLYFYKIVAQGTESRISFSSVKKMMLVK